MLIRDCTDSDVAVLEATWPTGRNRYHAQRFARQQAGTSTYLLAVDDRDEPFGCAEVRWDGCADPGVLAARPGCPEVNGLYVATGRRGQGVGTALLHAAEDRCRVRRLAWIGLGVAEDNARAARLYARLGYRGGIRYVDVWSYLDNDGHAHVVRDPCMFLTRDLGSDRPALEQPSEAEREDRGMREQRRARAIAMTADEVDSFLAEERTVRVATVGSSGPHATPLWYVWHGAALWLTSLSRSQRWVDLQNDPRIAAVVDAGVEYGELRGVELRGEVEVVGEVPRTGEPVPELEGPEQAFADRYSGGTMHHDGRHAWLRLVPEKITSWDFRKLDS